MANLLDGTAAQRYARIAGVLYLLNILAGAYGEIFVRARLIVQGDAAATAHHILASPLLFRSGIAGDLFMHLLDVPSILIFYVLLRPVSRDLSLLAALFNLVQTAVLVANKINLVTVLLLLGHDTALEAFNPAQLQALAHLALVLHEYGFGIGLIFFGPTCIVTGYLMIRSGYFPATLGAFQITAGVCYLVNSFAQILSPPLAEKLFPYILIPAFLGELGTALWLTVKGLNVTLWNQRISAPEPAPKPLPA